MAKTPVQRSVTPIDPRFNIPDGTDEFVYKEIDTSAETAQDVATAQESGDDEMVAVEVLGAEDDVYIEVPEIRSIFSQTLRRLPGGVNVIDVVVDIDGDGSGVSKYEFRVTKT